MLFNSYKRKLRPAHQRLCSILISLDFRQAHRSVGRKQPSSLRKGKAISTIDVRSPGVARLDLIIRPLESSKDYEAFEDLQRGTWGQNLSEVITASQARIVQRIGGIAAGAFDAQGEMLGLLFGLTGFKDGTPLHWSHMLAVRNGVRDAGIGRKLKLYQRETLLARGINRVFWTFDPLVARNAHLNFNSLGVEATEYIQDMYGPGDDSVLFQGIGTDRFVALWRIDSDNVKEALTGSKLFDHAPYSTSPLAVSRSNEGDPLSAPLAGEHPDASALRVEIPPDIHSLRDLSVVAAARWREITRSTFQSCLTRGYEVAGFYRDELTGRCYYCLRLKE